MTHETSNTSLASHSDYPFAGIVPITEWVDFCLHRHFDKYAEIVTNVSVFPPLLTGDWHCRSL